MSPPRYSRTTSHGKKVLPAHARPSRPAPLKTRNASSTQISKAGAGWSKSIGKGTEGAVDLDDEDMAGLPHFCAMCEKQIITPGSSILYCSESCRRKDGNKPLAHASIGQPPSPVDSSRRTSYYESSPHTEILPMRSPTMVRPPSIAFSDSSDTSLFDSRPSYGRTETEAARYLAQFSSPSASPEQRRYRPQYERASSHSNLPSLSHTPGSMASSSSYSSARPLPSRTNPYSVSFGKSLDLVTPLTVMPAMTAPTNMSIENSSLRSSASTSTAFRVVEGELSYERKAFMSDLSPGKGSLKQLFSHDTIKPSPRRRSGEVSVDPK